MNQDRILQIKADMERLKMAIFVTERATKDERPGSFLHQQLERHKMDRLNLEAELYSLQPTKHKKKKNEKRR